MLRFFINGFIKIFNIGVYAIRITINRHFNISDEFMKIFLTTNNTSWSRLFSQVYIICTSNDKLRIEIQ